MPEFLGGASGDGSVKVNVEVNQTGNAQQELKATAGEVRKLISQLTELKRTEQQAGQQTSTAARAQADGMRQLQQARARVLNSRDVPAQYTNQARVWMGEYSSRSGPVPGIPAGAGSGGSPGAARLPAVLPMLRVQTPPPLKVDTSGLAAAISQAVAQGLRSLGSRPMPSYAVGGPVRETGPAIVHRGEYVIPRHLSQGSVERDLASLPFSTMIANFIKAGRSPQSKQFRDWYRLYQER